MDPQDTVQQPQEDHCSTESTSTMERQKHLYATKEEVLDRVKQLAHGKENIQKTEMDHLKTAFYHLVNTEKEAAQKKYLDDGGDPMQYVETPDPLEEEFKAEMSIIKERRQHDIERLEQARQANLKRKMEIIQRIKQLTTTPDDAATAWQEVKALQQMWRDTNAPVTATTAVDSGATPVDTTTKTTDETPAEPTAGTTTPASADATADESTTHNEPPVATTAGNNIGTTFPTPAALWNEYKLAQEQFYDLLKMNIEAREYDFRKNLERKTALCEAAERLAEEPDVISAFHQLQELHVQYRETGPVAPEHRDDIWARFKQASTIVNRRHAAHFDALRAQQEDNLAQKSALCDRVETIDYSLLTTAALWETKSKEVIAIQNEWKTIGFAPKAMNTHIFERFRNACDQFFTAKNEYFTQMRQRLQENTQRKRELVNKAQELQSSVPSESQTDDFDWRTAADALVQLQRDWKTIGLVPRKIGDQLWSDFNTACNAFFEAYRAHRDAHRAQSNDNAPQSATATHSRRSAAEAAEQQENMQRKLEILEKMQQLVTLCENEANANTSAQAESSQDARQTMRNLIAEYNAIGHVPYKEKDKLYAQYHELLDALYRYIPQRRDTRRDGQSHNTRRPLSASGRPEAEGNTEASNAQRQMARRYEALRQQLENYENNLAFLSASSSRGNTLIDDMRRNADKLREELARMTEKMKTTKE